MNLAGQNILVAGLGESGLAMTRWLVRAGANVTVADSRSSPPNRDRLEHELPQVELIFGSYCDPVVRRAAGEAKLIAVSPGVSLQEEALAKANAAGVPLVSEIELFAWALAEISPQARVAAITGSNGKTTTTALTAHLLQAAGYHARAAGNISPSALDALMAALDKSCLPEVWVLELSSFQLETTANLNPTAAAILNISEDHLDRYADLDDYTAAKARILKGAQTKILNRNDARVRVLGTMGDTITFGLDEPQHQGDYGLQNGYLVRREEERMNPLVAQTDLALTGAHNAQNAMAALAFVDALGWRAPESKRDVIAALKSFPGLAHRSIRIAVIDGVDYIDDSKGTNVGATLAAIAGLGKPIAIILGGDGKGQDFRPLGPALAKHARAVALIGRDAERIDCAIHEPGGLAGLQSAPPCRRCSDLPQAVRWLASVCRPGDAVLLSPACASLDMFTDYRHRANVFAETVAELQRRTG